MALRLNDEAFIRWAKVVIGLQIAKDGSIKHIKTTMRSFVMDIQPANDRNHVLKYILNQVDSKKRECDKDCTRCVGISDRLRKELRKRSNAVLIKCNETRTRLTRNDIWWSVCKIYISSNCINDSAGPKDVDPQAILHLMMNCKLFDRPSGYALSKKISISDLAKKLNSFRNNAMHSVNNKISEEEMNDAFDAMEDFIKETNSGFSCELIELRQLKRQQLVVGVDEMINKALQLKKESLRREIQERKSTGKSVEIYEVMLQHTNDLIDKIKVGKELDKAKDNQKRKEKEVENLNTENKTLKDEVERLKEELDRMKRRADAAETQENKTLKDEVERLKEELDRMKSRAGAAETQAQEATNRNVQDVQPQQQREDGGLGHTATGAAAGAVAGAALGPAGSLVGGAIGGTLGFVRDLIG